VTLLVFGSARSSPGATTAAIAVAAWIDGSVVVEADPDGGVLAVRYGLAREPGLVTLAATRSLGESGLLGHAQTLPGGTRVVVAPESAERATNIWRVSGSGLVAMLGSVTDHVVVDGGRLGPSSPSLALLPHASVVAVMARPVPDELLAAADRVEAISALGARAGLVLVGDRPYTAGEVAAQLGCDVLGVIADDRRGAKALTGGASPRSVRRSMLMRSARGLAERLTATRPRVEPLPEALRP
jgi:hypothetical protein